MEINYHPGQIIEFIEEGRIITAAFLEEQKGRLRVLTENKREVRLSPNRVVHVSQKRIPLGNSRERMGELLQEISQKREELSRCVDVQALWEVLHEQAEEYPIGELAELSFGKDVGDDHTSAVMRAMLADRIYFRFRVHGFRPNDPRTVEKILTQRDREKQKAQQIERGGQWIRHVWMGQHPSPPEDWEQIVEMLKEFAIYGKGAPRAKICEEMLKRAGMTHPLAAFKVLVRMGIWSEDEDLWMHRFGTRREFPSAVIQEAQQLKDSCEIFAKEKDSREDLLTLDPVTIDSPQTLDIDDAISVSSSEEKLLVGIHISDVASIVPLDSPLEREAALRGTSLYLPTMRIPMLPPQLSEDLCSLKEGQLRPAVSLILQVDKDGEVICHRFCLSWIKVAKRLSYEEADELISSGHEGLSSLLEVAKRWRHMRLQSGAMLLPLPEVTVRVGPDGQIKLDRRERESPSQVLVSEMMIQANRLAAQWLRDRGIPAIYRSQPQPRERIVEQALPDLFRSYLQRKLLNRAEYSLEPSFHHGLGVEPYTTVTSPIRRYLDMVVQRQLVASLKGEPPPYEHQRLHRTLMEEEETLSQANQLEQSGQRYWLLRFLEGVQGLETRGLILGVHGKRVQVLLVEFMVEASLPAASVPEVRPGQEVMVRVVKARAREDDLKVELC